MLNKIKKLLMKKKNPDPILDNQDTEGTDLQWTNNDSNPESGISEEEMKLALQQMSDDAETPDDVENVDGMEEIEPTSEEVNEMNNQADLDPEYLEYSSEAVGYENREQQWDTYRVISNYIGEGDSVLDFGAARGDFERFFETEIGENLDYIGVDMNKQLVDAGNKVYDQEVELICSDWFNLDKDVKQDWSINIGSSNLRYDADTVRDNMTYLQDTIKTMMSHSTKGSIILLASDQAEIEDGLVNWNAGDVFNWAQKEFGSAALDHSFSKDLFTIIIYKEN